MSVFIRYRSSMLVAALGSAVLVALPARSAIAQDAPGAASLPASAIGINPFAIILGGINAEGEVALSSDVSLGAAGTYFPSNATGFDSGEHYGTFDVKLRFYPQERAPRGFSIAVTVGATSYRFDQSDALTSGPTIGFEADYNWLLGQRQRFLVGTGLGIRRILGGNGDDVMPAFRFQIGYAFPRLSGLR